jgi:hypothetical protein
MFCAALPTLQSHRLHCSSSLLCVKGPPRIIDFQRAEYYQNPEIYDQPWDAKELSTLDPKAHREHVDMADSKLAKAWT